MQVTSSISASSTAVTAGNTSQVAQLQKLLRDLTQQLKDLATSSLSTDSAKAISVHSTALVDAYA